MSREELEKKVLEMVATIYKTDVSKISLDTNIEKDLGGASIQMVGLVSEFENEFDVMVQLQVAAACKSIRELVDKVEEQL